MSVHQHPTIERERDLDLDSHAAELRKRLANQIKTALDRYTLAEQAADIAKRQEEAARKERDAAHHQLRDLMKGRKSCVVGELLITIQMTGGIHIEPVTVIS